MTPCINIRILSLCDDSSLGLSREMLLRNAGYEVASLPSDTGLSVAVARRFDIAVLCHSLGEKTVTQLIGVLRRLNPNIRVIKISQYASPRGGAEDAECSTEDGPEGFLRTVASVLGSSPGNAEAHEVELRSADRQAHGPDPRAPVKF